MVVVAANISCAELQRFPGMEVALDSWAASIFDPAGSERNRLRF